MFGDALLFISIVAKKKREKKNRGPRPERVVRPGARGGGPHHGGDPRARLPADARSASKIAFERVDTNHVLWVVNEYCILLRTLQEGRGSSFVVACFNVSS